MTKKPDPSEFILAQMADLSARVAKLEQAEILRVRKRGNKNDQRRRESQDVLVIKNLAVPASLAQLLVETNWLDHTVSDHPDKIKEALERMLAGLVVGEVKVGRCHR